MLRWLLPPLLGVLCACVDPDGLGSEQCHSQVGEDCLEPGVLDSVAWDPRTISVVLPCFNEGEFARKTVKAVFGTVPSEALHEIIVVDDGSDEPLHRKYVNKKVQEKYRVKLLQHDKSYGLIKAKFTGGVAATGDVIVFFDCHVAPIKGWHAVFLERMKANYKRVVVPRITDLNIDTWKERSMPGAAGFSSCYMTWDVDFKWFDATDEFVPVLSGGLLGISRRWFNETGGYDERMAGWGGENIDQSLRTWLCGGEIVAALDARVPHMWRTPADPRTQSKRAASPYDAIRNKMRAGFAWMGNFSAKLLQFPQIQQLWDYRPNGVPWHGDLENILTVRSNLGCRPFEWFLYRFRNLYVAGGLLPPETFLIRNTKTKRCLEFDGLAGVSQKGTGGVILAKCKPSHDRQRWHLGNVDISKGGACCSGLRAWNTDQCLVAGSDKLATHVCDVSGQKSEFSQLWSLSEKGLLQFRGGMSSEGCAHPSKKYLKLTDCKTAEREGGKWEAVDAVVPLETKLYQAALRDHPEWQDQ